MKIENIETVCLSIPFEHGGESRQLSGREWPTLDYVFLRVDTDAGISGWGDAFGYGAAPATRAMVEQVIAPSLIGADATDIAAINHRLQQENHLWGRYGITIFAISGIDIALWDIVGKAADKPVYALLGGQTPKDIPGYASLFKYADPELVGATSRKALDQGYGYVKLHEIGIAEVAAAREAMGDGVPLMVDTNCPWTPMEALDMAKQMKPYDLYWLEEPIFPPEDYEALSVLEVECGIPLAAGENACTAMEFEQMFLCSAVSFAQPSVTKVGGITEAWKIATMAEDSGSTVIPHCPYFGPGFLASLHLATAMREDTLIERFYLDLEAYPLPGAADAVDGSFRAPDGPGLGQDPDPNVLKDYAVP